MNFFSDISLGAARGNINAGQFEHLAEPLRKYLKPEYVGFMAQEKKFDYHFACGQLRAHRAELTALDEKAIAHGSIQLNIDAGTDARYVKQFSVTMGVCQEDFLWKIFYPEESVSEVTLTKMLNEVWPQDVKQLGVSWSSYS
jgi:hypothetical protein